MVGIEILNQSKYIGICRKISSPKSLYKDLHQETIITFIKKSYPIEEINGRNELHIFFYRVAWLTFNSYEFKKTYINPHHYTDWVDFPEQYYSYIPEDIEKEESVIIDNENRYLALELQSIAPQNEQEKYNKNLLELHYVYGSGYNISKVTGVPVRTIYADLKEIKSNIKKTYGVINKG